VAFDRKTCVECRAGQQLYPIEEDGPKRVCMNCRIRRDLVPFRKKLEAIVERSTN